MLEIFARLNAKGLVITGSGSKALIDIHDLCGILASLDEHHSWYVYALIEQRKSYNMDLLHRYCQQILLQEMNRRKFKSKIIKKDDCAYGITKAVLYGHFHSKGKCDACNGLGFKAKKRCIKCDGKGIASYKWAEKVSYGFPFRKDLTRKWYQSSCSTYDHYLQSILWEIHNEVAAKLSKVRRQAKDIAFGGTGELFDDI